MTEAPFIHLQYTAGSCRMRGAGCCFLGHQILAAGGTRDGIFAEWRWDGRCLTARHGRYGIQPLFYYTRPGEICLSPSIERLLEKGAPAELDESGLAAFLRLGFFLGEDTAFRAIRSVPPDCKFEWTEHGLKAEGQVVIAASREIGRREAIDTYIELFRCAVARRLPENDRFALPLSGGRDSRHILLELCRAGRKPAFCATVPRLNAPDREVASEVCRRLEVPHVVVPAELSAGIHLRKNRETNFCTLEHEWIPPLADYLRPRAEAIYDGLAGDVLSESRRLTAEVLQLYRERRVGELASALLRGHEAFLGAVLRNPERFSLETAQFRVEQELVKHERAPNPVGSFILWNRTRRAVATAPFGILMNDGTTYAPYLDHAVFDFLASLPAELLLDRTFHTDTIRTAFPEMADVPFASRGENPRLLAYRRLAWETIQYLREVPRDSLLVRNSYLLPRLLRCVIDGGYSEAVLWLAPTAIYLLQLGSLQAAHSDSPVYP